MMKSKVLRLANDTGIIFVSVCTILAAFIGYFKLTDCIMITIGQSAGDASLGQLSLAIIMLVTAIGSTAWLNQGR